jgi:hypothetical protein
VLDMLTSRLLFTLTDLFIHPHQYNIILFILFNSANGELLDTLICNEFKQNQACMVSLVCSTVLI